MKITDLVPDNKNARRATPRSRQAIKESLEKLGAGRSILLDKNGAVIAGNKTLEAAKAVGLENVITVETTGDDLVAVVRTDIDLDSPEGRELAIADNRTAQFAEWDTEVLSELSAQIDLLPYFNADELKELGVELPTGVGNANAAKQEDAQLLDAADELRKKWNTALGQIWEIPSQKSHGTHRLMCGSSISQEDVALLFAGAEPVLMVTDPPYGVNYDPHWRDDVVGEFGQRQARGDGATNDDTVDWTAAWKLFPGNVAYVWHAGRFTAEVAASLQCADFEIRSQIIWAKQHFALSRGHYHWQHEPCWYATRSGSAEWCGDRTQSTLWSISSLNPAGRKEERVAHGTQKPVECMARPMRNHFTEGYEVYDPFIGSGTSLVAAEQTGRIGYGMEIEPKYVAVALERLANLGLSPKLTRERT
jgi:DNA modification methylase